MKVITNKGVRTARLLELSIVLGLVFSPVCLYADQVTEQGVRAAVQTWVRYVTADADPNAVIERMEPYDANGQTVAYVAHLGGGGFCLCGADELVLPVYFYSPQGTYAPENPNFQYILWEIAARTEYLSAASKKRTAVFLRYQQDLASRALFWQRLRVGIVPERVEQQAGALAAPTSMELDLTTEWAQSTPYNDLCPMGDGGRCVVGCAATAGAQVMKYWNWPSSGTGSLSYGWDGDQSCNGNVGGGTLNATFSDAYDWQNMPDDCVSGCSGTEEAALAELSYEVGVAVQMDYGVCLSGANPRNIESALESYFRYDPDAYVVTSDLANTMVEDIQWLRPIVLSGWQVTGEGHGWVVLGYDTGASPTQFLMNMGWGGGSDGWYSLDTVPGPFNQSQELVAQIAPLNLVKFVGNDVAGDGSPGNPYQDISTARVLAPDGATLIFKAGSTNTFPGPSLTIDRPCTLKGRNVTIRRQ
ncbi:MAG: C10 family peptidase [Planctomycetota bacterium]|jgi:hypothetical protein